MRSDVGRCAAMDRFVRAHNLITLHVRCRDDGVTIANPMNGKLSRAHARTRDVFGQLTYECKCVTFSLRMPRA